MGEGFKYRPPEAEPPQECCEVPRAKVSVEQAESYDRAYWTPERIASNVANFFEKMERNERRMRTESQRLLEKAIREEEARKTAEKEILERELVEAEEQRRQDFLTELDETDAQRRFRHTIEWMVEQSNDQIQDLAINFLQGSNDQNQSADDETDIIEN